MKETANARFAITSWDEKPVADPQQLPKMTRATVLKTLTGAIEGQGHVEYVMTYRPDGYIRSHRVTRTTWGNPVRPPFDSAVRLFDVEIVSPAISSSAA